MHVLLLGPHRPEMVEILEACGDQVCWTEDKLILQSEILADIDFLVSYGYKHILKKEIVEQFHQKAINIHISLLPWNRGYYPNVWSFLENTPKGVTIHYIDSGIDTGEILAQKELFFSDQETLKTSYDKLSYQAIELFRESWQAIRASELKPMPQSGGGSFHFQRDLQTYEHLLTEGWDTSVAKLIGQALVNQ